MNIPSFEAIRSPSTHTLLLFVHWRRFQSAPLLPFLGSFLSLKKRREFLQSGHSSTNLKEPRAVLASLKLDRSSFIK